MKKIRNKIINDPVHGFISIPEGLPFDIIEHPYFQRLRRIKQLGLTHYVYPGALHTRFHHALGAMHLMQLALKTLSQKGHYISEEEEQAAIAAILLHDIGHGPFSHTLEHSILEGVNHEALSVVFMKKLNAVWNGALTLTIAMFEGTYHRPFFHQLVSSQLDMDRMDYLRRDCYFTGVVEGNISAERIIKMLDLHQDRLVVEAKGIYSIENFITSRRLMYWQVYLHKTTVAAEEMLIQTLRRAKQLSQGQTDLYLPEALAFFFKNPVKQADFDTRPELIDLFAQIDDIDVWYALKRWQFHSDKVLAYLSKSLLTRKLASLNLQMEPVEEETYQLQLQRTMRNQDLTENDAKFLVTKGSISNAAYLLENDQILIKKKNGDVLDVAQASDLPNITALSRVLKKYYLCYPKHLSL